MARLCGTADRAFKLLSLTTAGEAAEPGPAAGVPIPAPTSLRDALAQMVWSGAEALPVAAADGAPLGRVTLAAIVARGRQP